MSNNRMFPYLMSGIGRSDVDSVLIEQVESLNESSRLLQTVDVKPNNYCSTSKIMISMVKPSLTASSSSDSISSMDKKLKKGDIWFFMYLMLYVSYLILGSLAFRSMELQTESGVKNNFRDVRQQFQQKYSNVIGI